MAGDIDTTRPAAALDEVIVATSALMVALSESGRLLEQRLAAQLAVALLVLATARGALPPEPEGAPAELRLLPTRAPHRELD